MAVKSKDKKKRKAPAKMPMTPAEMKKMKKGKMPMMGM